MEVLGVIGNPIGHSLSPVMHNQAFAAMGKEAWYVPLLVQEMDLERAIFGAQALGFTGLNVTVPFKEKVIPFMDELTDEAKAVGSVNTILFKNGRLFGHSTDGIGFVNAVTRQFNVDLSGKNILVLGAGGAARAIIYALLKEGASLIVVNRTKSRAEKIRDDFQELARGRLQVLDPLTDILEGLINEVDLIVNTTSVGMKATLGQLPLSPELLRRHHLVVDIIYNPEETALLKAAKEIGCRTQNGVDMLVGQAAASWEFWWNGLQAPIDVMRQAVVSALAKES